ncbi:MAG: nucleotidyl transferase AbiEii/AbiGii toxin family protein [Candidatus Zapsychrus exili]|nr:nucleotidyl transferase AbiEii/AbiGii toxin family protein [Candidatus Zapsychrus exili]
MDGVARLAQRERDELFNETVSKRGDMPFVIIEKDFWVCWALEKIFTIKDPPLNIIFKGGTTLSKVFNVINRFSEDIDLSILRDDLGFSGNKDVTADLSGKQIRKRLDDIQSKCITFISDSFLPALKESFMKVLGEDVFWELSVDEKDPQTILFVYPREMKQPSQDYVKPTIWLELGARSDHWPASEYIIKPYSAEEFPEHFSRPSCTIKTLEIERTFWEKATILHAQYHRSKDLAIPDRFSRHYYDLALMIKAGLGDKALSNIYLLDTVREHNSLFFKCSWASYNTAVPGTLKLVPLKFRLNALKHDYRLMQQMIFSIAPSFEEIMEYLQEFEDRINNY